MSEVIYKAEEIAPERLTEMPRRKGFLERGGVKRYTWADCFQAYRWSAIRNIFIPILQWSRGLPGWLWWSQLEKSLSAFEDLKCIELVEG